MNIRCRFGFHDWRVYRWPLLRYDTYEQRWITSRPWCSRCGATE